VAREEEGGGGAQRSVARGSGPPADADAAVRLWAQLASSTKGHGNALPLTLDNVNAWAAVRAPPPARTPHPVPGGGRAPGRLATARRAPQAAHGGVRGAQGPGSPKLGGSSPRSPTGRRLTSSIDTGEHRLTSQLVMVDDVEAQPLSPAEEVAHVLVYGAGAQDEDEGATAGGKFGRGRGRRGSREENVAGLLLDRAPSAGSKGSSSKGSKGSKRAYRKRREEQARRVAEEAAATGAVAQPKKSALRPVSHEGSVADDPRAARTLTPSESAKGGEGDDSEDEKKLHSTASLQSKVAMQQRRREKFATRSCNEEMLHFLRKLIISQQRWYNRTWVYLGALFIVLFVCTISMAFPSRQIPVLVNMAPTTNQGGRRRFLVVAVAHFTRELVLDDGFSRLTKQELSDGLRSCPAPPAPRTNRTRLSSPPYKPDAPLSPAPYESGVHVSPSLHCRAPRSRAPPRSERRDAPWGNLASSCASAPAPRPRLRAKRASGRADAASTSTS
jgi:hypothetical protein